MESPLRPTADRWVRVKAITADALERPQPERVTFLAAACSGDDTLLAEVASLLGAHEQAGAFLDAPAVNASAAAALARAMQEATTPVLAGRRVGPYVILREIGRGGMGVVYLAARDDAAFEKQVAIKVVPGVLAAESLVRRFREERRILATLDHPHIARLLDGGTTEDGLPYLVMEYVDGIPLDAYAEDNRLPVRDRLALFGMVCAAVQYAHQRLVIHRDIKARNILVTRDGVPKLLDFGIAKLVEPGLDPDDQTRTVMRALTLDAASPEQVRGEPLTVTSDVYALGVLLYRLLTGQSPYGPRRRTDPEMIVAICDETPPRPSAVAPAGDRRQLRGELDWITLQALRKEADRRYPSVASLADDVERHASGRAVAAAPDSWSYRTGKFLTRNRVPVAIGALLAISLAGGVMATLWQARRAEGERARAEDQRARAERRFGEVRTLANSVVGELHDAIKDLPGATPARKLLVARAAAYLDSLAAESTGDEGLQRELASAYDKIGDAQGNPYVGNLGEPAAATISYAKAHRIHAALAEAHPGDAALQEELAASHDRIADVEYAKGDGAGALRHYRAAADLYEKVGDAFARARVLTKVGTVHMKSGDHAAALETYRATLALMSGLAAASPSSIPYRRGRAIAAMRVGDAAYALEDFATFAASQQQADREMRALARENPGSADLQRSLALVLARTAHARLHEKRPAEAVAVYGEVLALQEALAAADPQNVQVQFDVAHTLNNLAHALRAQSRPAEALRSIRRAIAIAEQAHARSPESAIGPNIAELQSTLADILKSQAAAARR